jgi:hypothetical protein
MYQFKNDIHTYNFYVAEYGSWNNDRKIVFRVREGKDIHERTKEKGIKFYDRIWLCNNMDYIQMWLDSHIGYELC